MNLFIALNKVLFSMNERVGHLGGKEVNREFWHRRFLACEQALRGAQAAGREKEGELATTDYTFFSQWFVQLQRSKIQGLFKDKFQFLRSKIYSINWRSLTPFQHLTTEHLFSFHSVGFFLCFVPFVFLML